MQNSPERILEGISHTLRGTVAPSVQDAYALTQVLAAAELLENLVTRVEWRCADLAATVDEVAPLLAEADGLAPAGAPELAAARSLLAAPPAAAHDNDALLAARDAHLAALAGVQAWLAAAGPDARLDGLHRRVEAVVGARLGIELERLAAARRLAAPR
jgi:hypothetical protein